MNRINLSDEEVNQRMATLPHWKNNGTFLERTFVFPDFLAAVDFVNRLTGPTEDLQHHPDIHWVYNRLTIRLNTHDTGGITGLDFELASRLDGLI